MELLNMQSLDPIKKRIKKELDKERYQHTLGVMYTAGSLAMRYDEDLYKAMLCGLLHDCAKCIPVDKRFELCNDYQVDLNVIERENPALIHAKLGAELARDRYNIQDELILDAIRYHTTGRPHMTLMDKIVYIADYIEPNRELPHLKEIRRTAFQSIDEGLCMILSNSLDYLKKTGKPIDPLTEETYQYYRL